MITAPRLRDPGLRASDEHHWSIWSCQICYLAGGLIGLPLRATFSPAHPLARRDVPWAQARIIPSSSPLA